MIEIARLSGWPYLALVFTHILILHMSMRAGEISAAGARFKKRWNDRNEMAAGMAAGRLQAPARSRMMRGLGAVWWCSRFARGNISLRLASEGRSFMVPARGRGGRPPHSDSVAE